MTLVIRSFTGANAFLSNFHPWPVGLGSITYPTAEHAFQACKTLDPAEKRQIAQCSTPGKAKRRGQFINLRPGWNEYVRFAAMLRVLRAKFALPSRAQQLVDTRAALLVEGNIWHDQEWGDCACGRRDCREAGQNHLGRLLMIVRSELVIVHTDSTLTVGV